jgi:hypothetical protein
MARSIKKKIQKMQKFVKKIFWPILACISAEFSVATYHF